MTAGLAGEEPSGLLANLVAHGSALGLQLEAAKGLTLREYLRRLWDVPSTPKMSPWLSTLVEALGRTLVRQGRREVEEICSAFARRPVLQQADHSNLLLDEETFLNNYLFHIAGREARQPFAVTSQCSTVVCFSRRVPPTGPVFLHTRGAILNVFGRSKRVYKDSSFCALPSPVELAFSVLSGPAPAPGDPVLSQLLGRRYPSAPDAFRHCNDDIWSALAVGPGPERVQVDEAMTSEALALHLEDDQSPVHHLLFEEPVRDAFLDAKREIVDSSRNIVINRAEPDGFWLRRGDRLYPVVLAGTGRSAEWRLGNDGCALPLSPSRDAIAAALRRGDLYTDRLLAYLVRCLLPGAVAVGGTIQQDYVASYREILLETHRRCPFLTESELRVLRWGDVSRLGGAPLIELDPASRQLFSTLGPDSDLAGWAEANLDRTVGETIGTLRCAWYYAANLRRVDERRAAERQRDVRPDARPIRPPTEPDDERRDRS